MAYSTEEKKQKLLALAKCRQATIWSDCQNLNVADDGFYECDHVSTYSITAGNRDSKIFVMLQDASSTEALAQCPKHELTRQLGYTPDMATNKNLICLLKMYFHVGLHEIYASNLFPFIKIGGVSDPIADSHLRDAATQFAKPQVEIVEPKLVIALGVTTFNYLVRAFDKSRPWQKLSCAIAKPVRYGDTTIWCQAHTSRPYAHRKGWPVVYEDWALMAGWYHGDKSEQRP